MQARILVTKFAEAAAQEAADRESAMEEEVAEQDQPFSAIHALIEGFSENGLMQWYLKMVKAFNLGPKRAVSKATGQKRGHDGDEDDDTIGQPAAKKGRSGRRSESVAAEEDDDEEVGGGGNGAA